jgi:putative CocE/NonD family hydrolase
MKKTSGFKRAVVARLALGACVCGVAVLQLACPAYAAQVTSEGYIPMPDGARLHYALILPSDTGRFPTLFEYDPYSGGSPGSLTAAGPDSTIPSYASYADHGYAVIGVNIRGTGCSTGYGDWLDAGVWGRDGAAAVEWIAAQKWSDGHVGMFGTSFSGISQLAVAGYRPPHLDAISPFAVTTDGYRDVAYPGGIFDQLWTNVFTGLELAYTGGAVADGAQNQDTSCGALNPSSAPSNVLLNAGSDASLNEVQHPYLDSWWTGGFNSIDANVGRIDVPVFGCQTWQDDAISSRAVDLYLAPGGLNPSTSWFVGNNGPHMQCQIPQGLLLKFFDHYLKGVENGFQKTPHITWQRDVSTAPAWTSHINDWADTVQPLGLYLHQGGLLNLSAPSGPEQADTYLYPTPSPDMAEWGNSSDAPDGSVSYTTPPLSADAGFFGSGSVDLWLSSTASDTDVQVTLTEVRPDGQEQYLQRGFLRASHRKLDPARSTVLRPLETDLASDATPLIPGQPTLVRVELRPFGHVFRKGSSIRLTIDTPAAKQGGWGFAMLPDPAQDTIYHDPVHVSALVLPLIPGATARAPLPACGTMIGEACRTNNTPVPAGNLTIPPSTRR